jgi:hypothetical protein
LSENSKLRLGQLQATCKASIPSNQQAGIEVSIEIFSAEDKEADVL